MSTRGRGDSILLELESATADTKLEIHIEASQETGVTFPRAYVPSQFPATDMTLSFESIGNGPVTHALPAGRYTDRVSARVVNPQSPLDRTFDFSDSVDPFDGDYYYLRIKQLDGRYIWSSPWWVGGVRPR